MQANAVIIALHPVNSSPSVLSLSVKKESVWRRLIHFFKTVFSITARAAPRRSIKVSTDRYEVQAEGGACYTGVTLRVDEK